MTKTPGNTDIGDLQWHSLLWTDCPWIHHEKPGEIAPPKFDDETLHGYIQRCHREGGGVTLNIGIYEDGTLAEKTVEQVKRIKKM